MSPEQLIILNSLSKKEEYIEVREGLMQLNVENKKLAFLLSVAMFMDKKISFDSIRTIYENYINDSIPFQPIPEDLLYGSRTLKSYFSDKINKEINTIPKHKIPWIIKTLYISDKKLFKNFLSQIDGESPFVTNKSLVFLTLLKEANKLEVKSNDISSIVRGLCSSTKEADLLTLSTFSPILSPMALNMVIYSSEDPAIVSQALVLLLAKRIDNSIYGLYSLLKAKDNDSAIKSAKLLSKIILNLEKGGDKEIIKDEFNQYISKVGINEAYSVVKNSNNSDLYEMILDGFGKKLPQKYILDNLSNENPKIRMLVLGSIIFPKRIETRYIIKKNYSLEKNAEVRAIYEKNFPDIIN